MDESGNHHSWQTDTRTQNQTPHVLAHSWVLNNEETWTLGGEHHTLWSVKGGQGRDSGGQWGGKTLGEMPEVGDGGMEAANHIPMCVPMQLSFMFCTCTPKPKTQ